MQFVGATLIASFLYSQVNAFYLPGVAPHSYVDDEPVDLKVNKLRYCDVLLPIYILRHLHLFSSFFLFFSAPSTLSCHMTIIR